MDPQNNNIPYPNNPGMTPTPQYNPTFQPQPFPPQQFVQQPKGISAIAEVYGPDGVDRFAVAAGNTVLLIQWLSQSSGKFWLKSKDLYGRPMPLVEFTFNQNVDPSMMQPQQMNSIPMSQNSQPVQQIPQTQNQNDFVNKRDFEDLRSMVADLHSALAGPSTPANG